MKESAFKSKYTLAFKNTTTEEVYKRGLQPRVTLFNKIISFVLFVTSFLCFMLIIQKMDLESRFDPIVMIIPNGIVAFLFFLSFILSLFIKSVRFHVLMKYFIYTMMTFTFIFLRYYTRALAGVDMIAYTSVMNVEFIMRIFFVIIGIFSFMEILIMSILVCIVFFSFNLPVFGSVYLSTVHIAYYTLILTVILISYYYVGEKRLSFFYNNKLEENNNWYNDVLDNMNNGFICIQNQNFKFMNKTLINLIRRKLNGEKEQENYEKSSKDINPNKNFLTTNRQSNLNVNVNKIVESDSERRSSSGMVLTNEKNYKHEYESLPVKSENNLDINNQDKNSVPDINHENTNNIINFLFNEENFDLTNGNNDNQKQSDHENLKSIIMRKDLNLKMENFSTSEFLGKLKKKYKEIKIKKTQDDLNYSTENKNANFNTSQGLIINSKNFVLLGNKKFGFQEEDDVVEKIFEISFRYYTNSENETVEINENDYFEFIFNDVTRTKLLEEKNAEFKYKSLFLSKIAHEFKNPLICITELVDQTCDIYNSDSSNYFMVNKNKMPMKQLKSIKSLSDYLLILIKDLDYFSQRQLKKDIEIAVSEVNLSEILNFTRNVGKSLLMKNGKSKDVKIIIEKSKEVPKKIKTDEIRLKQILINLLSNAIKFTNKGYIKIGINIEDAKLKFTVSDTGLGMTNLQMENIFKPFKKGRDLSNINTYGSGLGLSIVYEMTQKLGSNIKYCSQEGQGTTFWFSIPVSRSRKNSFSRLSQTKSKSVVIPMSKSESLNRVKSTDIPDYFNTQEMSKINTIGNIFTNIKELRYNEKSNNKLDESDFDIRICPESDVYKKSENCSYEESSESDKSSGTQIMNIINLKNPQMILAKEAIAMKSQFTNIKSKNVGKSDEKITNHDDNNQIEQVIRFRNPNRSNTVNADNNMKLKNLIINNNNFTINDNINNIILDPYARSIIIVDDEKLTRQSTLRMLKKICLQKKLNINFIEAEDGIECVYLFYKMINAGTKISGIISDETMNFMTGSKTAQIIGEIIQKKGITKIPYFILTAYEDNYTLKNMMNQYINDIFTKPLMNINAEKFLNSMLVE